MDALKLMKELRANYEQEGYFIPKETGLDLIESTAQVISNNYSLYTMNVIVIMVDKLTILSLEIQ